MLCQKFNDLSHYEKIKYIGELLHSCQSDDFFFSAGESIILLAKEKGMFDNVIILPEQTKIDEQENQLSS